jgi:hypothetical protein
MASNKIVTDNVLSQEIWDSLPKDGVATTTKKYYPFKTPLSESTRLKPKEAAVSKLRSNCPICGVDASVSCGHMIPPHTSEEAKKILYILGGWSAKTDEENVKRFTDVLNVIRGKPATGPAVHMIGNNCMVCGVSADTPCIHLTGNPVVPQCAAPKPPVDILMGIWPTKEDPTSNMKATIICSKPKTQQSTVDFKINIDFDKMKLSEVGPKHQSTLLTKKTDFPPKVANGHPDCFYCLNERDHLDDVCNRLRGHPGPNAPRYDIAYVWEPAEPSTQGASGTDGIGYYSGIHGVSGQTGPQNKFDFTPRVGSPCPYCARGRYHAGEYCMDTGKDLGIAWTPCKTCKDDPFHLDGICGSVGSHGCTGEGISGVLGSTYAGDDGCQGATGIPGHYMDNITTCRFCDAVMTKGTICCNATHEKGKRFRDVCWCGDPHLDGSACGNPGPMYPVFIDEPTQEDGVSGIQGPIGPIGPTYTSEDGCQGVDGPCGGPIGPCNMECPSINCEPYCDHFKAIGNECPRGPEGTPGPAGVPPCSAVCPSSYCTPDCQYKPKPMSYSGVAELKLDTCPMCNKVIVKGAVCCGSVKEDWVPRKGRFDTPGRKWLPPAKKRITCGTSLIGAGPNALAHRQERKEKWNPPLVKEKNDFIHPRTAAYIKAHPPILVDDMEEPP